MCIMTWPVSLPVSPNSWNENLFGQDVQQVMTNHNTKKWGRYNSEQRRYRVISLFFKKNSSFTSRLKKFSFELNLYQKNSRVMFHLNLARTLKQFTERIHFLCLAQIWLFEHRWCAWSWRSRTSFFFYKYQPQNNCERSKLLSLSLSHTHHVWT